MSKHTPLTLYVPGTLPLPGQPAKSDKVTPLTLIYNPKPRVVVYQYHHAPRLARWLEEHGAVHTFEPDADGIERQVWRLPDEASFAVTKAEFATVKLSRRESILDRVSVGHSIIPGLNLVGSTRWRLLTTQSDLRALDRVRVLGTIGGDKSASMDRIKLAAGVTSSQLVTAIRGAAGRSGDAGTGDPAVLDRLLEIKGLEDAVLRAIEQQRAELKRVPKAA